ncbi:MAG TPA: TolC family protein [Candidatus Cybelea sp.]|jgi:outer membrane protein|nr:TolC family protein [Candidatus Cybelea sp.]
MTTLYEAAKSFLLPVSTKRSSLFQEVPGLRTGNSLVAFFMAAMLAVGPLSPAFAQSAAQNPPSNPAPTASVSTGSSIAPVSSLGLAKYNFTNGPHAFPNLLKPYQQIHIDEPVITNSPRLQQLIHDGKLELSLEDAVELALENSLDIGVQRYYPWIADASILKAKSGGSGYSTPGGLFASSTAFLPSLSYDPTVTSSILIDDSTTPVNNPLISGTGTGAATLTTLETHTTQFNNQVSRGFETGTNLTVSWNNTRTSSTSTANLFNPAVQSTLTIGFTQALLNGFGIAINTRNIRIAKNNRKIADWAFAQQAITTVTNTITAYWELVYARANVKVDEQAITVSQKLYSDNKKQLDAGTMAPLDVTRAQSELATDRQNLIVARTVQLQDEQILKNAITKDPLAPDVVNVEIITTDQPKQPAAIENPSFEDSIKEAFEKRPELQEQLYNLKNADIDMQATRNALLPTLTLSGQYSSVGLAGNAPKGTPTLVPDTQLPILDENGNAVLVNGVPIFEPEQEIPGMGTNSQGFTTAQSQIFHNRFPDYSAQLTLSLPLHNRSAQADSARAILTQRQQEMSLQQLKNAALLDVRNTYIALTQDRAQVDAASEARQLQQETFDAEQKKYRLGASTVYNVILTQRDLIAAQGTELRALANLEEAKANYERALGRTLEVNHVTIADAKSGAVERETLIPGTLHGKVVGTEDLFREGGSR